MKVALSGNKHTCVYGTTADLSELSLMSS